MFSKIAGPTIVLTLSTATQNVTPLTFSGDVARSVRISAATGAYINFNTTATTSSGIIVPAGEDVYFRVERQTVLTSTGTSMTIPSYMATYSTTATLSVMSASTSSGSISITPVL